MFGKNKVKENSIISKLKINLKKIFIKKLNLMIKSKMIINLKYRYPNKQIKLIRAKA